MASSTGVGPKASYATSSISTKEPVVSVDWLRSNLRDADIKVNSGSCCNGSIMVVIFTCWDCRRLQDFVFSHDS